MPTVMLPPNSPFVGLPASPRPTHQMLTPLDTSMRYGSSPAATSEKTESSVFIDPRQRRRDSLIFANATIPLSPTSSVSNESQAPFDGLVPRRRNGFARLFCCFGRGERARRRAMRFDEYEKVGEKLHWSEY